MKALASLLIIACTSACSQQAQTIRAPVNVATRLYSDCIEASLMSAQITPTRVGIIEYVEAVDDQCLTWMVIWFKPLVGYEITQLQPDAAERLRKNLLSKLQSLTVMLRKEALR